MPTRLPTPPGTPPPLVLCADGGGSKVCVVIRSADGLEVRGTAGPCNVYALLCLSVSVTSAPQLTCSRCRLSVGHTNAIKQILLATYRALAQLPSSHLHPDLIIPPLDSGSGSGTNGHAVSSTPSSPLVRPIPTKPHLLPAHNDLASPYASRPGSPTRTKLQPLNVALFQYVWLGLAGISTPADQKAFLPLVTRDLCVSEARVKISNGTSTLSKTLWPNGMVPS